MPLELWAGPECTVNRLGDTYHDQLESSQFVEDPLHLERLAGLGISRMRFPLLWERTETSRGQRDWRWSDTALAQLSALKVEPIVGLLHHGSGPAWTNLLDPALAPLLANYAGAVAERYPYITDWTPVNEPLTTARFSGLYGFWYPHRSDDASFVRALLNQIYATVGAMKAVRRINPHARLVQTEDLGFATSSPSLAYQAKFENLRRWLSFDLLTGRVDRRHGLWRYLRKAGASEYELDALCDEPCPPDIFGVNSYITSERHLDERIWIYPPQLVGGNKRHRYADVEAVRVNGSFAGGFEARLRETCERYGGPVAITEVHLGCRREEQLRWLHQAWAAASTVRDEGRDVRAVTCWATLGTFDWNSLVTRRDGHYEPGLWDLSSTPPRETALAGMARHLSSGKTPDHPVLGGPGWWQRETRLIYGPQGEVEALPVSGRPLLITGATGTLGKAFARICEARGLAYQLLSRADMDIADPVSVEVALQRWQPWAVVNTAGFVRVDDAERDGARQWRENAVGPGVLAGACAQHDIRLLAFSSDLVFDGAKTQPYIETDTPQPLNAYGRAKHEAERRVLAAAPRALMVRSAAFFGPWDAHNFVTTGLQALRRGEPWTMAHDQAVSPTYVPDLVHSSLDLLVDGERGIWHLANQGSASWSGLACMAAEVAGLETRLIQPVPGMTLGQLAARPRFSALGSARGNVMPTLQSGLERYMTEAVSGAAEATGCAEPVVAEEAL
ncbi:MAG TPA: sugar nucleotide-binding protein [Polaromonas sp.]|uniref:sugar nucleotide-binding protein n=1 Tax=Polaromonas sp. TaxID=1869339 RepID=UPI002D660A7F|nr:sugar nucleotide-binding protein [Polaromonas sp.]HYW55724.1 sugar nucleotide-binding protein [Polaromonas sp.]